MPQSIKTSVLLCLLGMWAVAHFAMLFARDETIGQKMDRLLELIRQGIFVGCVIGYTYLVS